VNDKSIVSEINALRQMTVGELRVEWERLYGEPSRSRNRDYLWRRLAWRVQEIAYGGLTGAAKARIVELTPATFTRSQLPAGFNPTERQATSPGAPRRSDPRLPKPGSTLLRRYKNQDIRVRVLDDGFEYDGRHFDSLTEIARVVTGSAWNGYLFFGLARRTRSG
jgi:hypothetical protein